MKYSDNKMTQPKQTDASGGVDGIKGWLVVMVSIFFLKLVVDNYLSYGILVDPVQIVIDFANYCLMAKWRYFGLICACYFQQILHMYLIEKFIISNLISEKMGMILHAFNAFFLGLACSVIFYIFQFHPIAAKLCSSHVMFTFTKCWSFAYVNMIARRRQKKEKQANGAVTEKTYTKVVEYSYNASLSNIISYMVFTPPVEYQLEFKRTEKKNIKILPIAIFKILVVLYVIVLIAQQYVLPELKKSKLHISQGNHVDLILCILKVFLPLNLIWLLYMCVIVFNTYLPAYAEITGMKGVAFQSDWWNAENIRDYWPKWNIPMFVCFKTNVLKPLLQLGYSKITATTIVAMLSGVMHEITIAHTCGLYNGITFLSFVLQIPSSYFNVWIGERYGKRSGNLFLLFCLCTTHCVLIVSMYNSHKSV